MPSTTRVRAAALGGAILTAAMLLISCSSRSGGDQPAAADPACVQRAASFTQPYRALPTALPPAISPLSAKPKPGVVIRIANGKIGGDLKDAQALMAAATAVGWTGKTIVYDGSVEDLNAKYMGAIEENPTAINVAGVAAAEITQPLKLAHEKGIVTVGQSTVDEPNDVGGFRAVVGGKEPNELLGKLNAYLALQDAGCRPVGSLVVGMSFPTLKAATAAYTAVVKQECPSCTVTNRELLVSDLDSPAATNAIISAVQSDPNIKYVYSVVGNLADGVPAALSAAGRTDVKVFGSVPDNQSILGLQKKEMSWWISRSTAINGWVGMDAVLRTIDMGKPISIEGSPAGILTPENVGTKPVDEQTYPANYQDLFKKVWRIE